VYLERSCSRHGAERLLLEASGTFFDRQAAAQAAAPRGGHARVHVFPEGKFRVEHPAAAIVLEITDDCNETCSTCIAGSYEGAGNYKSVEQVGRMLQKVVACQGIPDVVFVSGGEPTIHPHLFEILDLVYAVGVEHVVLISNGRRFAQEADFASHLKSNYPLLEVYLQFDTFDSDLLIELRGHDLSAIRRAAIDHLASAGVMTTLVAIVQYGKSFETVGSTVEFAASMPNIRGVQFQPLRATGRHAGRPPAVNAPSVGGVVRALASQVSFVGPTDILPHPLGPGTLAIGYWDRSSWTSVTQVRLHQNADRPRFLDSPAPGDIGDFRISIVCYLDRFNWRSDQVAFSPIQVVTEAGELMPLDLYYLLGDSTATAVPVTLRTSA
jgi:uncharacterized Fe-S cluster-containing radical SAM superfamily protein